MTGDTMKSANRIKSPDAHISSTLFFIIPHSSLLIPPSPYRLAPFLLRDKDDREDGVDDHREEDRCRRDVLVVQLGEMVVQKVLEHVDRLVRVVPVEKIALAEDFQGVHDGEDKGEEETIYYINEAWEGTKIGEEIYVNINKPELTKHSVEISE